MRKLLIVTGGLAALGGLAVVARADIVQTFSLSVPPAKAGKPMALNTSQTTSDTGGPSVQPPPLKEQIVRFNKGGTFNGSKFKHCKKATLLSTTRCPKATKVGTGNATAVALPIVPLVNSPLTLYEGEKQHGHETTYVYAIPDIGPNLLTIGEVTKLSSGPYGDQLDFKVDDIQTLPGAPNASVTSVNTKTPIKYVKKGKKKIPLLVAPNKCSGKWLGEAEFHYKPNDGSPEIVKTVQSSTSCSK